MLIDNLRSKLFRVWQRVVFYHHKSVPRDLKTYNRKFYFCFQGSHVRERILGKSRTSFTFEVCWLLLSILWLIFSFCFPFFVTILQVINKCKCTSVKWRLVIWAKKLMYYSWWSVLVVIYDSCSVDYNLWYELDVTIYLLSMFYCWLSIIITGYL